jgi:hypothetical protein
MRWLVGLVVVFAASGCKRGIDPGYKAALEGRYQALCACTGKGADDAVACYGEANRAHPEPKAPGGQASGLYQESLRDEDQAFVRKMEELASACDIEVAHHIREYKDALAKQADQGKADEERAALAGMIAAKKKGGAGAAGKGGGGGGDRCEKGLALFRIRAHRRGECELQCVKQLKGPPLEVCRSRCSAFCPP